MSDVTNVLRSKGDISPIDILPDHLISTPAHSSALTEARETEWTFGNATFLYKSLTANFDADTLAAADGRDIAIRRAQLRLRAGSVRLAGLIREALPCARPLPASPSSTAETG